MVTFIEKAQESGTLPALADVAASVQEAIVDSLIEKTMNAVEHTGVERVAGGGGVLANTRLRLKLTAACNAKGVGLSIPDPILCTDNGAMIGVAGAHWLSEGQYTSWAANAEPGMRLG